MNRIDVRVAGGSHPPVTFSVVAPVLGSQQSPRADCNHNSAGHAQRLEGNAKDVEHVSPAPQRAKYDKQGIDADAGSNGFPLHRGEVLREAIEDERRADWIDDCEQGWKGKQKGEIQGNEKTRRVLKTIRPPAVLEGRQRVGLYHSRACD